MKQVRVKTINGVMQFYLLLSVICFCLMVEDLRARPCELYLTGSPDKVVRVAHEDDIRALLELMQLCYREKQGYSGWTTEAHLVGGTKGSRETLLEAITGDGQKMFVVIDGSEIIACISAKREGEFAHLGALTVKPKRQNAGIGKDLMWAAERWFSTKWGLRKVQISVIKQRTELVQWYQRQGYRTTEEVPYPLEDERYGTPAPELTVVIMEKEIGGSGGE